MASPIMAPSSSIFGGKMESGLLSRFSPSISAHGYRKQALNRVLAVMAPPQPQRSPATTGSVKHAMTMTEKILSRASERPELAPGENVWVNVDVLMTHDVCGPGTIGIFKREFGQNAKMALHRAWLLMALLACICLVKENNAKSISYHTIASDRVPCGIGHRKNCRPQAAEPYQRSCSKIFRCRGAQELVRGIGNDGELPQAKVGGESSRC